MGMVDLSKGDQGRIKFRNGEEWWCPVIDFQDGEYLLRYEHGWYMPYNRRGKLLSGGLIIDRNGKETRVPPNPDRDVIEFEPGDFPKLQEGCNP